MTTMIDGLSLYFHIPFCIKKCEYCAFYSLPNTGDGIKALYFDALMKQLSFLPNDRRIISVYFGGGTPPVLGVYRLCKLISAVKERFTLQKDCEITVEVNPGAIDFDGLKALYDAGANRLSVGVQSADDIMLTKLGRIHRFDDALECINNARKAGFKNISADVMFALPGQSCEGFVKSLEKILELQTEHISAYSLQLEEGTPFYKKRAELDLPGEDCEESQYKALCELMAKYGYEHYEISSFAKKGFLARHNSVYWSMGEYFGLGAAAHSYFNGKRFFSPPDVMKYIESAQISLYAPTNFDGEPFLTEADIAEETLMLGLRTSNGAVIPDDKTQIAREIAKLGYGEFDGERLRLNDAGFRISNAVIAKFI